MSVLRSVVDVAHSPWRPTGAGRTPRLFWCAAVGALMLFGLAVAFAVLLDPQADLIVTTFANAASQTAAAAA